MKAALAKRDTISLRKSIMVLKEKSYKTLPKIYSSQLLSQAVVFIQQRTLKEFEAYCRSCELCFDLQGREEENDYVVGQCIAQMISFFQSQKE